MKTILLATVTMFGLATAVPAFAMAAGQTEQVARAEQRGNQEHWGNGKGDVTTEFSANEGRGNRENWGGGKGDVTTEFS